MSNLYICHTQAHLILSTGLSKGRFANDENHLILFEDFNLSTALKEKLRAIFSSCLFLEGGFPASNKTFKSRIKWYRKDIKTIGEKLNISFDRVFAVCDWVPPVQFCLKQCQKHNSSTEFIWLEDGILSYFANIDWKKGLDSHRWTMSLRNFFFKHLLGLSTVYDRDFEGMGGLSLFKSAYVLYPDAVREPYKSTRNLIGISEREYLTGVEALYEPQKLNIPDNSILLIIDKLETYQNPEKVKEAIVKLKESTHHDGREIYCKFHPREENIWPLFNDCVILDKYIGAECLYLSLKDQRNSLQVIGMKSAGLMSAKKMGFKVSSLFNSIGETNSDLVAFFTNIGIELS